VEKDFSMQKEYDKFVSVAKIFDKFTSGVKTNRDHFLTDFDRKALERRIQSMRYNVLDDDLFNVTYHLIEGKYWKTAREREKVRNNENWSNQFFNYSYRPFDIRWIYYQPNLIEIGRGGASKEIMQNFFEENLGLVTTRQLSSEKFCHALVSADISDMCFVSNKGKESGYVFPLYLYPSSDKKHSEENTLHKEDVEQNERAHNLNPVLIEKLNETYKRDVAPEQIFYYIYAVLYSNIYRTKYNEFLKIDFPRVAFTSDYELFNKMADLGSKLVDLHLLSSTELSNPISKFRGQGSGVVEKVKYYGEEKRVYINNDNYFDSVEKEVFEYQIGGYQVCDKWLKDRKGRALSLSETEQYCKIVTAIAKTLKIQQAIDSLYSSIEESLILL
jgi:predicted helicase